MLGAKNNIVELIPHNTTWQYLFQVEVIALRRALSIPNLEVEHVGSTAIPNIASKAILDMLIPLSSIVELSDLNYRLGNLDYYCKLDTLACKTFVKEKDGAITHHLSFIDTQDPKWQEATKFRDRMLKYPNLAKQYEGKKVELANLYANSPEAYTATRAKFIDAILTTPEKTLSSNEFYEVSGYLDIIVESLPDTVHYH